MNLCNNLWFKVLSNCKHVELSKYTDIIKKGNMLDQRRQFNMCINSLNPYFTALFFGGGVNLYALLVRIAGLLSSGKGVSSNCLLLIVLRLKSIHSLLGREPERGFNAYIYPRHSERSKKSQGLEIRTTKVPRHPEFISGSYQCCIVLQSGKMLKQVQHDKLSSHPSLLPMGEGKYEPFNSSTVQPFNSAPTKHGVATYRRTTP